MAKSAQTQTSLASRGWTQGLSSLMMLAALTGTIWWAVYALAAPGSQSSGKAGSPSPGEPNPILLAHVDVRDGVVPLNPAQMGRVVAINVKEYEQVKQGHVLLQIDDRLAQLTLKGAKDALATAEAKLEQTRNLTEQHAAQIKGQEAKIEAQQANLVAAKAVLKRVTEKVSSTAATEEDRIAAAKQVDSAQALVHGAEAELAGLKSVKPELGVTLASTDVERVKSEIKKAELAIEECKMVAPSNGQIIRIQVTQGEMFAPQRPQGPTMYFVPEGKPLIVRAESEQEFADGLTEGMAVDIYDDTRSSKPHWSGKVTTVGNWYTHRRSIMLEPLQFNDVRTLECIIDFDPVKNGEALPRIGQRLRVKPRLNP